MSKQITPTDKEVFFDEGDIIVSKTDTKGRLTYVNDVFCAIAGYSERELLGQPHSLIRHPSMPRAVFRLLWSQIQQGHEIFAYVKNITKTGDFYWVFAHVTPSFGADRQIAGFHSNRRVPRRAAIDALVPLYDELSRIETQHRNAKEGLSASAGRLADFIESKEVSYDELVLAL